MNLIEQQNVLRGLPDDALPKAIDGGSAPPFLVLSEINRRKTARERYERNHAKYAQNNTSVAEELLGNRPAAKMTGGSLAQQGMPMQQPPMGGGMPGGLDAAMAPPPAMPGGLDTAVQGFAHGGYAEDRSGVQHFDTGGYAEDYNAKLDERLAGLTGDRDRARAMALISAGSGMMAGRSSNAFANIGEGINAALPGYQQAIEGIDNTEMDLWRRQFDVSSSQHQDELAEIDRQYRIGQDTLSNNRADAALMPAAVRESMWYEQATPEQRAAHDKNNAITQARLDKEAEAAYNNVYRQTERKYFDTNGNPNYANIPNDISELLADPETAQRGKDALTQIIREEALLDYTVRYPSYAAKAEEYAAMAPPDAAGGVGADGVTVYDSSTYF